MAHCVLWLVVSAVLLRNVNTRLVCAKPRSPHEIGEWHNSLQHLDSAVVENRPVTISEGQLYVYDNHFPGYVIKYINIDNLAVRTCGATSSLKNGGIGADFVLLVLHAPVNHEIRSVIDVWGIPAHKSRLASQAVTQNVPTEREDSILKHIKSQYLLKNYKIVGHNK